MVDIGGQIPAFLVAIAGVLGGPVGVAVALTGVAVAAIIAVNTPSFQKGLETLWTNTASAVTSFADSVAATQAATQAKAETKVGEIEIPKDTDPDAFFGVLLNQYGFQLLTEAMSFSETLVWISNIVTYGTISDPLKTNWGIYCMSERAAWNMGYALSLCRNPIGPEQGYPSKDSPAAYWHYHPLGRELYGVKYEHFHIWFGATI